MQKKQILGVILAGGTSRRFGSDKSVALLAGRPLLEWVIERAQLQVGRLLLNAHAESGFAAELDRISDCAPGEGPLAGILAGLNRATALGFTHVASFACDTPFFRRDAVDRLSGALDASTADFAVARCGATVHRIFALWPVVCKEKLSAAFAAGARRMQSVERWLAPAFCDFAPMGGPDGDPFFNINTRADLEKAERWLSERHTF